MFSSVSTVHLVAAEPLTRRPAPPVPGVVVLWSPRLDHYTVNLTAHVGIDYDEGLCDRAMRAIEVVGR